MESSVSPRTWLMPVECQTLTVGVILEGDTELSKIQFSGRKWTNPEWAGYVSAVHIQSLVVFLEMEV